MNEPDDAARDLASYGPLLASYAAAVGGLALLLRRRRRTWTPTPGDVAFLGIATFKLSRLISKERVFSTVREPFVQSTEPAPGSEVNSTPAGDGVRRAVGELLTCPFCLSVWLATALTAVFAVAPRAARLAASVLTSMAVADVSQYAYQAVRTCAE